ncbi:Uncharacterised protein [uncultured archaeon]|nr:Uncharacterised protein [uncultured archaeon]
MAVFRQKIIRNVQSAKENWSRYKSDFKYALLDFKSTLREDFANWHESRGGRGSALRYSIGAVARLLLVEAPLESFIGVRNYVSAKFEPYSASGWKTKARRENAELMRLVTADDAGQFYTAMLNIKRAEHSNALDHPDKKLNRVFQGGNYLSVIEASRINAESTAAQLVLRAGTKSGSNFLTSDEKDTLVGLSYFNIENAEKKLIHEKAAAVGKVLLDFSFVARRYAAQKKKEAGLKIGAACAYGLSLVSLLVPNEAYLFVKNGILGFNDFFLKPQPLVEKLPAAALLLVASGLGYLATLKGTESRAKTRLRRSLAWRISHELKETHVTFKTMVSKEAARQAAQKKEKEDDGQTAPVARPEEKPPTVADTFHELGEMVGYVSDHRIPFVKVVYRQKTEKTRIIPPQEGPGRGDSGALPGDSRRSHGTRFE